MRPDPGEVNHRRVRVGLAMISVVFVVALVLVAVVDDPTARALMGAVLVLSFIRAALLVRSLRRARR